MTKLYEDWQIGPNHFWCYNEISKVHRELIRFNPRYAKYEKEGRVIGWQHLVRRTALRHLDRKSHSDGTLNNKDLEMADFSDFRLGQPFRNWHSSKRPPTNYEPKSRSLKSLDSTKDQFSNQHDKRERR